MRKFLHYPDPDKLYDMPFSKIAFVLFLLLSISLNGQNNSQWGNLKKGPYQVGYKTLLTHDLSRNYLDEHKPIQIYVWYPTKDSTSPGMVFGDYFEDAVKDFGNDSVYSKLVLNDIIEEFKSGALNPSFNSQISDAEFEIISNTKIPCIREAKPAEGKFPLVLHTHVSGVLHQSIMLEYLASHGFVVMSISMYNTAPVYYGRGEDGSYALLSSSDDLGFVLAQARQFDFVDPAKAAVVGMLAANGLAFQFKESLVDAIACLDCSSDWSEEYQRELPFFDPRKIRIPILEIINSDIPDQNTTFLDSLPFSDRYVLRLKDFLHSDFYPFPKIAHPDASKDHRKYEFVSELTRQFLSKVLNLGEGSSIEFVELAKQIPGADLISSIKKLSARDLVYTENEFLSYLRFGQLYKIQGEYLSKSYLSSLNQSNLFSVVVFLCRDKKPHAKDALAIYNSVYPADPRRKFLQDLLQE